ncbi:hypothetical protein [Paenibacillus silviterrae]|uniref:hypothetical protein n=1 Tax=Paenibacillus silviterrae TaxID=3242194 RepID=UPI002542CB3B|nr:hypothetical protein [Paenibacillus chinjuensis]
MEALLLLAVALGLLIFLYRRSANWRTLMISSGENIEELEARFAFLKSQQVRCRVQTEMAGQMGAIHASPQPRTETLKLEVHVKDLDKAGQLLEQFEAEQPGNPF